ncbi:hypothetical protein FRACA_20020 [Frankia canadensis]|uniref:Uncharacterized protein n=1 Tax=Frankia canadensis TaxID=1836972 RepID=A0A2I2KPN9_9ACTN|nr:hypothetical protein FRACA_20020 [Frankia canadensis]SOU54914.1 hypothetical protein FRACA_20020 [Frankia canadensis]
MLLAIDGFDVGVRDTEKNPAEFGYVGSGEEQSAPKIRVVEFFAASPQEAPAAIGSGLDRAGRGSRVETSTPTKPCSTGKPRSPSAPGGHSSMPVRPPWWLATETRPMVVQVSHRLLSPTRWSFVL